MKFGPPAKIGVRPSPGAAPFIGGTTSNRSRASSLSGVSTPRTRRAPGAFTLIELILVMAILAIAVSITAPALANFFRGRILDSEARRLLGLTRQGQSRAVSEGVPMDLWLDTPNNAYGLEAEPSYEDRDTKAVSINMDSDLQLQVSTVRSTLPVSTSTFGSSMSSGVPAPEISTHPGLPRIRFLPDGSVSETSPESVELQHRDGKSLWLKLSRNRLSYEIQDRKNS